MPPRSRRWAPEAEVEKRWQARVEQAARTSLRASNLANIASSASGTLQLVASLVIVMIGVRRDRRPSPDDRRAHRRQHAGRAGVAADAPACTARHQLQAVSAAFKRIDELMREAPEDATG